MLSDGILFSISSRNMSALFSGSTDGVLKSWVLNTQVPEASKILQNGEAVRDAHEGSINCIHISANGRYLATGSRDKTAKVCSFILIHFFSFKYEPNWFIFPSDMVVGWVCWRQGFITKVARRFERSQSWCLVRSFFRLRKGAFTIT